MLAAEQQPAGQKLFGSSLKDRCADPHELGDHVQQDQVHGDLAPLGNDYDE